jgi:hypothetical protein
MDERMLPTDSVSYSFPVDMWCPVKLLGSYGSLKWEGRRQRFWLRTQAGGEENISATAIHDVANVFLSGRVTRDIRPLCMFDRPGVVVRMMDGGVGLIVAFDAEATHHYKILCEEDVVVQMHPYAVEDAVLPVDSSLVLRLSAFPERERYHFRTEDDEEVCFLYFAYNTKADMCCACAGSVRVDSLQAGVYAAGARKPAVCERERGPARYVARCRGVWLFAWKRATRAAAHGHYGSRRRCGVCGPRWRIGLRQGKAPQSLKPGALN